MAIEYWGHKNTVSKPPGIHTPNLVQIMFAPRLKNQRELLQPSLVVIVAVDMRLKTGYLTSTLTFTLQRKTSLLGQRRPNGILTSRSASLVLLSTDSSM
jgi:hypothetical protein